jgi:error-prone DNA polymerase
MNRAGVSRAVLERLAAADTFRSMGADRRQALWQVRALADAPPLPLFEYARQKESKEAAQRSGRNEEPRAQRGKADWPPPGQGAPAQAPCASTGIAVSGMEESSTTGDFITEPPVTLPEMPLGEHVVNDYQTLRLSLKAHPMHFLRDLARKHGAASCEEIGAMKDGQFVTAAGVVLVRQRPGTAKGVVFMTIEDETGIANIVVWSKVLEKYRRAVMSSRLAWIKGRIQRHEDIIHVVANHLEDRSHWLELLCADTLEAKTLLANADEIRRPEPGSWRPGRRHPRAERIIPKSRDFR